MCIYIYIYTDREFEVSEFHGLALQMPRANVVKGESPRPKVPLRKRCSAVYPTAYVPKNRYTMFLAVEKSLLYNNQLDIHCFAALGSRDRALFQLLLYITYCFKGKVFQITLENRQVRNLSTPIREDFAEALLFCFVLDLAEEESYNKPNNANDPSGLEDSQGLQDILGFPNADESSQGLVNFDLFQCNGEIIGKLIQDEAFHAFLRLSLVKHKVSSLNHAMINMRDTKGEMSAMFDCLDYVSDTLFSKTMEKSKVQRLMGSAYMPVPASGRSMHAVPSTIMDLSLEGLRESLSAIIDLDFKGDGKPLFNSLMDAMSGESLFSQSYFVRAQQPYTMFIERLKGLVRNLVVNGVTTHVDVKQFIVFEYAMGSLITRERPDAFLDIMIHKHVPLPRGVLTKVINSVGEQRRMAALENMFRDRDCGCGDTHDCMAAYACLYNTSNVHPLDMVREDGVFEKLFPHLAKLKRVATEMKSKYSFLGGLALFESMATMVYSCLAEGRFSGPEPVENMYSQLSSLTNGSRDNSSLSLGKRCPNVHRKICRGLRDGAEKQSLNSLKVYDRDLVSHLFVDNFKVHRLFQASATFNYVITNTAPRYTIERCMLINFTAPGEGKTFINKLLGLIFQLVPTCIETLSSFTPQSFKYYKMRSSWTVMIEDTHNTEKSVLGADRDSCNIPNVFKHLLDDSILESNVVSINQATGTLETSKVISVHNCGFVLTTNTLQQTSPGWLDRSHLMTSEHTASSQRTRSFQDLINTVEKGKMDQIAATCLFRQNLVQCTNMISHPNLLQFSDSFDKARTSCIKVMKSKVILHNGKRTGDSQRMLGIINQMVFAEAMKLACHFVFDLWVPPWTRVTKGRSRSGGAVYNESRFLQELDNARITALDKLSFGQVCLEVGAVFKLCSAACLPDMLPKVIDSQAHFACQTLAYVLKQVHLESCLIVSRTKLGDIQVAGINQLYFSKEELPAASVAHETLAQCNSCSFPPRECKGDMRSRKLCSIVKENKYQEDRYNKKMPYKSRFKISSLTVSLEVVYDLLALYAPESHRAFWDKVSKAMIDAYKQGNVREVGGGFTNRKATTENDGVPQPPPPKLVFTLDFTDDPIQSMILDGTQGVATLKELHYVKSGNARSKWHRYECSAPIYYGGVIYAHNPEDIRTYNADHISESRVGTLGTFHGPRLNVCSPQLSKGVPILNLSSFCKTRTVYHQDMIILTSNEDPLDFHTHYSVLEEDWEWKDAVAAMNSINPDESFTVENLKADYQTTMASVKHGDTLSHSEPLARRMANSQGFHSQIHENHERSYPFNAASSQSEQVVLGTDQMGRKGCSKRLAALFQSQSEEEQGFALAQKRRYTSASHSESEHVSGIQHRKKFRKRHRPGDSSSGDNSFYASSSQSESEHVSSIQHRKKVRKSHNICDCPFAT